MISSFRSRKPFSTSVTLTFFLHAFLPFLEGWVCCSGALLDPVEWPKMTGISTAIRLELLQSAVAALNRGRVRDQETICFRRPLFEHFFSGAHAVVLRRALTHGGFSGLHNEAAFRPAFLHVLGTAICMYLCTYVDNPSSSQLLPFPPSLTGGPSCELVKPKHRPKALVFTSLGSVTHSNKNDDDNRQNRGDLATQTTSCGCLPATSDTLLPDRRRWSVGDNPRRLNRCCESLCQDGTGRWILQ